MGSKSTFTNSTSKSYALALYDLANENSELNKIEMEMNSLNRLLNESLDFKETIMSPTVKKEEKKNIMFAIAEKSNFSKTVKKFLGFLAIKNRLFFLNQIINSFLNLVSDSKGELKAILTSSKNLSESEKEKIQAELSNHFKSSIKIQYKYNPDLIGGMIIQVGSVMVDTSIKSKLKQLEKNMIEGWYAN